MLFEQSSINHLPINQELKCSEEWVDNDFEEPYRFHVMLPSGLGSVAAGKKLTFHSRERSSGTGILTQNDEMTKLETIHDGPVDPHFFEKGFFLEAKTGFQVWPGSRLMLQALLCNLDKASDNSFARLKYWQDRLLRSSTSLNILEFGSGIGVVGTSLAATGGYVLMTDLNVLANHGIGPNLERIQNRNYENVEADDETRLHSAFLTSMLPIELCGDISSKPMLIGCGYARPTVLNWFKPLSEQLSRRAYSDVDLIIACDCIFLRKLVDPMFNTVAEVFSNAKTNKTEEVTCLFTYQRRNLMGVFISLEEVLDMIAQRGWFVTCLAWRKVMVEDDGEHELYLFEISQCATMNNAGDTSYDKKE